MESPHGKDDGEARQQQDDTDSSNNTSTSLEWMHEEGACADATVENEYGPNEICAGEDHANDITCAVLTNNGSATPVLDIEDDKANCVIAASTISATEDKKNGEANGNIVTSTQFGRNREAEGKGKDVFSHLASEWSHILEERDASAQTMTMNGGPLTYSLGNQQIRSCYRPNQMISSYALPGPSTSRMSFMSQEQADKWVNAPEFQPAFTSQNGRAKTYAEAVDPYAPRNQSKLAAGVQFCPFYHIEVREASICPYLHGELCQICLSTMLDLQDTEEKRRHIKACLREQEKRLKVSLAIQKSKGIACCICLEHVKEKKAGEARFGLLPNCNHCFCITCIRKWRQETRYTSRITRSCPICRVESPFVCPSAFWVDNPEEKETIIKNYKKALRVKPCRLYNFGKGKCPFGDKCFYLHSLPDGSRPGQQASQRPKRLNAEGTAPVQEYCLWDFISMRDDPRNFQPTLPIHRPQYDSSGAESDTSHGE